MKKILITLTAAIWSILSVNAQDNRPSYAIWPSIQEDAITVDENTNPQSWANSSFSWNKDTGIIQLGYNENSNLVNVAISTQINNIKDALNGNYNLEFEFKTNNIFSLEIGVEKGPKFFEKIPYSPSEDWQTISKNLRFFKEAWENNMEGDIYIFYVQVTPSEGSNFNQSGSFEIRNIKLTPSNEEVLTEIPLNSKLAIYPHIQEGYIYLPSIESEGGFSAVKLIEDGNEFVRWNINQGAAYTEGGYKCNPSIDMSPVFNFDYDLVFDARTSNDFNFFLKVVNPKGGQAEDPYPFTTDGEWHTYRINITKDFQQQYAGYTEGDIVNLFVPILKAKEGNMGSDWSIDFTNIRLEPHIVAEGTSYYGEMSGTYLDNPIYIDYKFVVNEDQSVSVFYNLTTQNIVLDNGNVSLGGILSRGVSSNDADYSYVASFNGPYSDGQLLDVYFYIVFQGTELVWTSDHFTYIFGSSNEEPVRTPSLLISSNNVKATSAEITYDISLPSTWENSEISVSYRQLSEDIWKTTENSPILLSNLVPETQYSYLVKANIVKGSHNEELIQQVEFTTVRLVPAGTTWNGKIEGSVNWGSNENPVNFNYAFVYKIVVNEDQTYTIYYRFESDALTEAGYAIENPQVCFNNTTDWHGNNNELYESTDPEYTWMATTRDSFVEGQQMTNFFYFGFTGNKVLEPRFEYIFGSSNVTAPTVIVGEFEPMAWNPGGYEDLTKSVALPESLSVEDLVVSIEAEGFETWAKIESLNQWDLAVYNEIMSEGGSVKTNATGDAISNKCDGYINEANVPTVKLEQISGQDAADIIVDVPSSGIYKITFAPAENKQIQFADQDGSPVSTLERRLEIYPTFKHSYTYNHGDNIITDDIFSINGYSYGNNVGGQIDYLNTDEAKAALSNAQVYIPGVFGAEIYYWIDGDEPQQSESNSTPGIPSIASVKKRSALPEGYENYTNTLSNGSYVDLSRLNGYNALNLVMVKNGAITPLENNGTSKTAVNVAFSTSAPTGVDSTLDTISENVDIYTLSGICVAKGVKYNEIKNTLTPGLYIIGGKKILIK